jgi:predicted phage-related endonuclease
MMAEDLVKRQNERLELLRSLEQQLLRLNALEKELGIKVDQERKELRLQMIRIIAWMGV